MSLMTSRSSWQRLRVLVPAAVALASLLTAIQAWGAGVSVDDASWADAQQAKLKYQAGKSAYDEQDYEKALARFRESYEIVASPNSHLMVAKVLISLNRPIEAWQELALVIEEAQAVKEKPEKYRTTAEAAQALRKELEQKLGFVQVDPGTAVEVRGQAVPMANWGQAIAVVPGTVAIDVTTPTGKKRSETVEVAPGETVLFVPAAPAQPVATKPAPVACPDRDPQPQSVRRGMVPQTTIGYVAAGIGLVGWVGFATFGMLNQQSYQRLEDRCSGTTCPADLADDAERGRTYQALANVGLGVGIAGLGAGAALLLTAPRRARPSNTRLRIGPQSVVLQGDF